MNVTLPDSMIEWVEAQARSGLFDTASDYVRDLIRRDQERAESITALQRLISEGVESGVSERSPGDILDIARDRVRVMRRP